MLLSSEGSRILISKLRYVKKASQYQQQEFIAILNNLWEKGYHLLCVVTHADVCSCMEKRSV